MIERQALEMLIEEIRRQMVEAGDKLGFHHPTVYQLSCRLDELHNQLIRLEREKGYLIRRFDSRIREAHVLPY
ncbi:aspartyl-phosphate phosphatase Spo0E family protein [Mechercharimyces sp. CAU 1602]|uniref:aspartyl-phosphate phosphatase Spo0E family protein n=1 Tax=Mechercharimyces sp. CAU 1602 TaxID=2973933 RepID=UPI002162B884|nr:aspartyl-phosphate phosphatase Spo0E family protein [Mechercharimyces sp. CAU 1602]MCS1351766.1 aspartyl-phosphate phosphatase Spo0E family protein [Mechercharimyces sp. CAU 1602]